MTAQESILQNAYETTLALAIGADATETSVQVNAAPVGSPSASNPMYLVIDPDSDSTREYIKVTSRSGVSLTVVRNIDSDSGGLNAHAVGAKVRMVAMKQHFDDLNDRVDTIMNSDGTAVNTSGLVKDEDDMSSDSATHLATQQSIKAYVDNQVTAQDLDFTADTTTGTPSIDLDSETLNVAGGAGIDTSANGNEITVAIDNTVVTESSTDTLTNKTLTSPVIDTGVSGTAIKDEDDMSSDSATHLATQQSIKAYVDAQVDTKDTLAELDDVTITSVGDNDIIAYDNTSSKYINQTASEAGLATSAQGALADSATQPSDNISTLTNDSGFITASTTDTLTNKTIDADGTGNSITNIEDANIKSAAAIDASKIADGSVSNAEFQRLDGVTSDIQTQLDGKQASGSYITASSSDTLTNKTFDVEGTGNSISNIDVADFKAAAVVTEAEGIGSNDNDTTLPTSAAVKDYVDSNAGSVTASSTTTFTNKTIDANGTGNNISNIDIDNMTSAVIVTESEGIGSNDNDTTLPTSAAVVDYVANNAGSSNALVDSDSDFTLTDGVASGIHYELDNTDMADWNQGGVALTAAGGMFRHNQTQSATFSIASTEGTVLAGPITITGTVTNAGTMVIL